MICPNCGTKMNHHSDKLVCANGLEQPDAIDPTFGAIVEQFYSCPKCGGSASRHA